MTAEVLREAAALMRERAEAATPGPWSQHTAEAAADTVIFAGREWVTNVDNCPSVGKHKATPGGSICSDQALPNGDHIASWHPAVALAVANWLDTVADVRCGCYLLGSLTDDCEVLVDGCSSHADALSTALAYLGRTA